MSWVKIDRKKVMGNKMMQFIVVKKDDACVKQK